MLLIVILVFLGVFAVATLIMVAAGTGASPQVKRRLAALDSAVGTSGSPVEDEIADIRKHELLSAIPWINRLLVQMDVAPRLRLVLYQASLKWTVGGLLLMCITSWVAAASLVYWRTRAALPSIFLTVIAVSFPVLFVFRKRSQRFGCFEQRLPEALEMIVGALRAGHSLITAVDVVAREAPEPIAGEFRKCFDEQNYGLELRTAMLNLATRVSIQDLRMVVAAVLIQKESGGNLAEVLEKVAYIVRERFRLKQQIRVHTAQGRLTGWILSLLPVVLGIGLYLVNPKSMSILWTNPIGIKLLCGAAGLTIVGMLVIRKIVQIRV